MNFRQQWKSLKHSSLICQTKGNLRVGKALLNLKKMETPHYSTNDLSALDLDYSQINSTSKQEMSISATLSPLWQYIYLTLHVFFFYYWACLKKLNCISYIRSLNSVFNLHRKSGISLAIMLLVSCFSSSWNSLLITGVTCWPHGVKY